jgi:hypothetical protein
MSGLGGGGGGGGGGLPFPQVASMGNSATMSTPMVNEADLRNIITSRAKTHNIENCFMTSPQLPRLDCS